MKFPPFTITRLVLFAILPETFAICEPALCQVTGCCSESKTCTVLKERCRYYHCDEALCEPGGCCFGNRCLTKTYCLAKNLIGISIVVVIFILLICIIKKYWRKNEAKANKAKAKNKDVKRRGEDKSSSAKSPDANVNNRKTTEFNIKPMMVSNDEMGLDTKTDSQFDTITCQTETPFIDSKHPPNVNKKKKDKFDAIESKQSNKQSNEIDFEEINYEYKSVEDDLTIPEIKIDKRTSIDRRRPNTLTITQKKSITLEMKSLDS